MTKVITRQDPEGVVKVTRGIVTTIAELAEARAEAQALEARIKDLREQVLAEVGKDARVLIHNNIEVARISHQVTQRPDTKTLREKFPEVWESVAYDSEAYVIRAVTRKK